MLATSIKPYNRRLHASWPLQSIFFIVFIIIRKTKRLIISTSTPPTSIRNRRIIQLTLSKIYRIHRNHG